MKNYHNHRKKSYNFKDISEIMSKVFEHNIKIYPKVYDKKHFKIEIDFNGRKKLGDIIYNWKTEQKEMQEKIRELYLEIYERIQKRK